MISHWLCLVLVQHMGKPVIITGGWNRKIVVYADDAETERVQVCGREKWKGGQLHKGTFILDKFWKNYVVFLKVSLILNPFFLNLAHSSRISHFFLERQDSATMAHLNRNLDFLISF